MKIKEFHEKDAKAVAQIFTEAFNDEITRGMPLLTPERFVDLAKRPGAKVFVAENARDKLLGFLTLSEGSQEFSAQIHLVAVKKDQRRKGVGKELVRKAVEHARAVGRKKLKLFTRPWNTAMSKVCLELGFVPEAYLRRDYLDADLVLYSVFLG
jgi:ribosomal protein S18 acetylase RimI-like enzyme